MPQLGRPPLEGIPNVRPQVRAVVEEAIARHERVLQNKEGSSSNEL